MDKEKKLKQSSGGGAATFTGASINPNDTASSLVAAGSKNGTAVAASDASQNKNTASKDNNGEAKIEGEVETKEVAKKKPKKAAAKKEK